MLNSSFLFWPRTYSCINYLAAESENGAVIIGVPNAQHLKFYLQHSRPDLAYLDASSAILPAELPGRWYVFYEARNIPARWQKELSYREFYDILVVHLPGRCPIDRCLHEATGLLSEAAQANPGSALEQKIKLMLSGLSNLAAHRGGGRLWPLSSSSRPAISRPLLPRW
jgi:hypothetical protein